MSESVRDMMERDILLNTVVIQLFKQILNRLSVIIGVFLALGVIGAIIASLYYSRLYHKIQSERVLIKSERDSLRIEKEIFYGIKDSSARYKYAPTKDVLLNN